MQPEQTKKMFIESLPQEKRQYFRELDAMSNGIMLAMDMIEQNPDVEDGELRAVFDAYSDTLTEDEQKRIDKAIDAFVRRRLVISRHVEVFQSKPEELFERVFGFRPLSTVELRKNPWALMFVLEQEDAERIEPVENTGGRYLPAGSGLIKDTELDGMVAYVFKTARTRSMFSYPGENPVRKIARGEDEMRATTEHEAKHAFWEDYLLPHKEAAVAHRLPSAEVFKELTDPGFKNLSTEDQYRIVSAIIHFWLHRAMDGYFTGEKHRENLVSEFGANTATSHLPAEFRTAEFMRAFEQNYREKFFVLHDVLDTLNGKADSKKIEALAYIMPPDRIERLLWFIQTNPDEWLKNWRTQNTPDTLTRREQVERRAERGIGSL